MIKSQADAWLLFSDDQIPRFSSGCRTGTAVARQAFADNSAAVDAGDPSLCKFTESAFALLSCDASSTIPNGRGGLLKDRLARLQELFPIPLVLKELPDWQILRNGLAEGECDIIPYVGIRKKAVEGMRLSRPMMETDAAILYKGENLKQARFLVYSVADSARLLHELYPQARIISLKNGEKVYDALQSGKGDAYLGTICNCAI